jgi:hypothetical protein
MNHLQAVMGLACDNVKDQLRKCSICIDFVGQIVLASWTVDKSYIQSMEMHGTSNK